MTMNDLIRENEDLKQKYARAIGVITRLEKKVAKLEKERKKLKVEIMRLRKLNAVLTRTVRIAMKMHNDEAQYRYLKSIVEHLRKEEKRARSRK